MSDLPNAFTSDEDFLVALENMRRQDGSLPQYDPAFAQYFAKRATSHRVNRNLHGLGAGITGAAAFIDPTVIGRILLGASALTNGAEANRYHDAAARADTGAAMWAQPRPRY